MRYHDITHDDLKNGEGIRTVLWVSGCEHHCPGCQNPITWDINMGMDFDKDAEKELFSYLDADYCAGLTLSGGDPMHRFNREDVFKLCQRFRQRYGRNKTIWMYTGYSFRTIENEPIMGLLDVVVDGLYIEEQRNTQRYWCGSDNQLVWRNHDGIWMPDEKEYVRSLSEEQHEKEKGCC